MDMKSFESLKELPEKKRYFEFVTAALSVPVLVTVLLTNINNLKARTSAAPASPAPTPKEVVHIVTLTPSAAVKDKQVPSPQPDPSSSPTPVQACKKEIGPVVISSPSEGDVITSDPVTIDIAPRPEGYCAIVWTYRINGSTWSEYTDKAISLFNVPPGQKVLELKVKSVVNGQENVLKRTFTVAGSSSPTPTQSSSFPASPSATPQP